MQVLLHFTVVRLHRALAICISWVAALFTTPAEGLTFGDVQKIASLTPAKRTAALQTLLQSEPDERDLGLWLFREEARLRPSLRALAADEDVGPFVRSLLSLIAEAEDIRWMVHRPPVLSGKDDFFANRWAYPLVCALLDPRSEAEWTLLRKAARNDLKDRWVDAGAIQSLMLIGSPRSVEILEEARAI